MADLRREEELAYVLVSIVRDMAGRRVEDCVPELAAWINTVREEVRDEERSAAADELRETLRELYGLFADGLVVRDIGADGDPGYVLKAMRIVLALKHAQTALADSRAEPRAAAPEAVEKLLADCDAAAAQGEEK